MLLLQTTRLGGCGRELNGSTNGTAIPHGRDQCSVDQRIPPLVSISPGCGVTSRPVGKGRIVVDHASAYANVPRKIDKFVAPSKSGGARLLINYRKVPRLAAFMDEASWMSLLYELQRARRIFIGSR
jgi:hypothetical protein